MYCKNPTLLIIETIVALIIFVPIVKQIRKDLKERKKIKEELTSKEK